MNTGNVNAPAVTRAGWVCPHCQTAYSPDVQACHCSTRKPSLAERLNGVTVPVSSPFLPNTIIC